MIGSPVYLVVLLRVGSHSRLLFLEAAIFCSLTQAVSFRNPQTPFEQAGPNANLQQAIHLRVNNTVIAMLTRNHAMSLLGRGSLPQSNMIINTKAFSYTASKAFSSTMLAKRSAPFLPTYHAMTTAPDSRVEWFFVPDSVLDRLDTGAAKLAFQKSNPFNDPEVHNCKISFLPDDKYATWT